MCKLSFQREPCSCVSLIHSQSQQSCFLSIFYTRVWYEIFSFWNKKNEEEKDILNMLKIEACFMVIYSTNTYWASTTCQALCSLPTVRWWINQTQSLCGSGPQQETDALWERVIKRPDEGGHWVTKALGREPQPMFSLAEGARVISTVLPSDSTRN